MPSDDIGSTASGSPAPRGSTHSHKRQAAKPRRRAEPIGADLIFSEDDMFRSREELLAEVYHRQEERIAYDAGDGVPADAPPFRSAAG